MEELTRCSACGGPLPPSGDGTLNHEAGATPSAGPSAALVEYRNKWQFPMLAVSVVYLTLTVVAWAKGWESNTGEGLEWWIVDWVFSGVFLWDLYKRVKYAGRGRRARYCFELANLFDILVIASPALVPLGITSLGVVRIVRVVKVVWMALTTHRDTSGVLRRLVTQENVRYALNLAVVVSVLAFVVVHSFETTSDVVGSAVGDGRQMTGMIDAGWWLSQTVTTVGYGDIVVRTEVARFFGIILMATGVIAMSLTTAWVASIFIGKEDDKEHAAILRKLDDITAQLLGGDDEPPKAAM